AKQAERLGPCEHLLLGRGAEKTGGRHQQAILARAHGALVAAIYLDCGIEQARTFLLRPFAASIEDIRRHGLSGLDHKSSLQEYLQSNGQSLPEYRLAGTLGPDHRKLFQVEVVVRGETIASAIGPSKKEAEQEAARLA